MTGYENKDAIEISMINNDPESDIQYTALGITKT